MKKVYSLDSKIGLYVCGKGGSMISFVRDNSEKPIDVELTRRFRDAMVMFRTRVELLAKLDHKTTQEEGESMTLMLEMLLEGKKRLQA